MTNCLSQKLHGCVKSWLPSVCPAQDPNGKCGPKDRRPVMGRAGQGRALSGAHAASSQQPAHHNPARLWTSSGGSARRCAGRGGRGLGPGATAGAGNAGSVECGATRPGHCGPSLRCHHRGRGVSAWLHPIGGGGRAEHRGRRQRWTSRRRPEATSSPLGQQPPSSLLSGQPPSQAAGAPLTPRGSQPAPRPLRANELLSLVRGAYETGNPVSHLGLQITTCH